MMSHVRDREFERLYAEHSQGLLGFLVYKTGDRVLAEDLFADTFERVLRTRARFDRRRGSEKTWIYSIALNLLRDNARRRQAEARAVERTYVGVGGMETGGYDAVDEREALNRGLASLSSEEREAVSLRFGGDLTVPEIAKVTGTSSSTAHGRVYRALAKLREELGDDSASPD
jgi:RNA polymerase sigma factor (sigma-70 family)